MPRPVRTTTAELFPAVSMSDSVSLRALLERTRTEPLPTPVALALSAEVAQRVGAVHATGRLLGAFDASRVRVDRSGKVTLARGGSGALAPELVSGGLPSVQSDVWGLAHVVYEALTGRAPVKDGASGGYAPPSAFNPLVDDELDGVVLAALRSEPSERPTPMALQLSLEAWLEENPGEGASSALVERLRGLFGPMELSAKKPITLEIPLARAGDVEDLSPETESITDLIRRAGPDEPEPEKLSAGFLFPFEVVVDATHEPVGAKLHAALKPKVTQEAPVEAPSEPDQPVTEQVRTEAMAPAVEAEWLAAPGEELLNDDELAVLVRRPRWKLGFFALAAAVLAVAVGFSAVRTHETPAPAPALIAQSEEEELAPPPEPRSQLEAEAPRVAIEATTVRVPSQRPVTVAKRVAAKSAGRSRR